MGHRVGIDLGTTNSVIAFTELGSQRCVKVDANEYASAVMPSCVAFAQDGSMVVGARARRELVHAREFKRHMGEDSLYELGGKTFRPVELSALVLRRLKEGFEERHGPISGAVITVPAMFDEMRRRETIEAGRLAGLDVLRVINEPSAAAIAYALGDDTVRENGLVIDWGGGTLDVSVVEGAASVLDVKFNAGDTQLGGKDIDAIVMEGLLEKAKAEGHDLTGDTVALTELAHAAEAIKIHLSANPVWDEPVTIRSRRLFLDYRLTQEEFDYRIGPLVDRVFEVIERALANVPGGAISPQDVDDIVLVGGSCRLPLLQRRVEETFGRPGRATIDPMEVVALGAAYQAEHSISSRAASLVTLHSLTMNLGVQSMGIDDRGVRRTDMFTCLLAAGTRIPARATESFTTVRDNQDAVDIRIYELPFTVTRVGDGTPWDSRTIRGLPAAPAGSYDIKVTFEYGVDQTMEVTVDIPKHGISKRWVPKRQTELDERHDSSKRRLGLDDPDPAAGLGGAPDDSPDDSGE